MDKTQKELTAFIASLPPNLPELLNGFNLLRTEASSDGAAVTQRDLLELCGPAQTRKVRLYLLF